MQTPMVVNVLPEAAVPALAQSATMLSALLAAALGALLVLGVGFLHAAPVHDAAHDTRHAIGFPCH